MDHTREISFTAQPRRENQPTWSNPDQIARIRGFDHLLESSQRLDSEESSNTHKQEQLGRRSFGWSTVGRPDDHDRLSVKQLTAVETAEAAP